MRVLLLLILPLIHCSNSYSQGYPDDNESYSIFDESDLYIESNTRSQQIGDDEATFHIGNLGPNVVSPSKKTDPIREINGIPEPPPPPDAPINGPITFLFAAGLILAVKKLHHSFSLK